MFDPNEIEKWYVGKNFSTDWTSRNFSNWSNLFAGERDNVARILEIGSWEGRSAIFFLEFFRRSIITCVDPFHTGGTSTNAALPEAERRFDFNTASYSGRVTKIVSESVVALHRLTKQTMPFDLIYIDGSHDRDDVLIDSLLVRRLTRVGSVIIWDDYEGGKPGQAPETRPKAAIELFLSLYAKEFSVVYRGYQLIAQRLA
jgi:predicted O-methyltransferase YrrM